MKDLIQILSNLRSKAQNCQVEVAREYAIQKHENPAGIFAGIFNKVTLGIELISFYYQKSENATITNCNSVEEVKKENWERIITINRMIYVESMSFLEYHLKKLISVDSSFFSNPPRRIYLRAIIKEFENKGLISSNDSILWEGLIELRNCIVHNNAISEISGTYRFPKVILSLTAGQMSQGNLKLFPNLIDWILDSIKEVLINYKNP